MLTLQGCFCCCKQKAITTCWKVRVFNQIQPSVTASPLQTTLDKQNHLGLTGITTTERKNEAEAGSRASAETSASSQLLWQEDLRQQQQPRICVLLWMRAAAGLSGFDVRGVEALRRDGRLVNAVWTLTRSPLGGGREDSPAHRGKRFKS